MRKRRRDPKIKRGREQGANRREIKVVQAEFSTLS